MSECVGLHSTCHAASLRRLCIRAHGFSNSLKRVEAEPLLSLWVGGRGRCGLARGSSWTQESPCLVWASPAPSSASPWKGPAPRPPLPQRGLRQGFEGRPSFHRDKHLTLALPPCRDQHRSSTPGVIIHMASRLPQHQVPCLCSV